METVEKVKEKNKEKTVKIGEDMWLLLMDMKIKNGYRSLDDLLRDIIKSADLKKFKVDPEILKRVVG